MAEGIHSVRARRQLAWHVPTMPPLYAPKQPNPNALLIPLCRLLLSFNQNMPSKVLKAAENIYDAVEKTKNDAQLCVSTVSWCS